MAKCTPFFNTALDFLTLPIPRISAATLIKLLTLCDPELESGKNTVIRETVSLVLYVCCIVFMFLNDFLFWYISRNLWFASVEERIEWHRTTVIAGTNRTLGITGTIILVDHPGAIMIVGIVQSA
jgi:hypothetical protein